MCDWCCSQAEDEIKWDGSEGGFETIAEESSRQRHDPVAQAKGLSSKLISSQQYMRQRRLEPKKYSHPQPPAIA
jgi:hypothetical protein